MSNERWLALAKRIQAIAQAGLFYAESDYDRDRYQELSDISVEILHQLSDEPIEKITSLFAGERDGYATPKVDIRSVVFNDQNEILLACERADGRWSLPGGWADIGYSPKEVAVKEVREETGLEVRALRVLGIFDKRFHNHPQEPWYCYKIFILCEVVGGTLTESSTETTAAGFFSRNNLPPLSLPRIMPGQIEHMFRLRDAITQEIYCD